jgi:hypothetical protein
VIVTSPRTDNRPAYSSAPIVAIEHMIGRMRQCRLSGYNTRFPTASPELFLVEISKDLRRQQNEIARNGKDVVK